ASSGIWKNRRQQIVGAHSLNGRRNFRASLESQKDQCARCVPSPTCGKERRIQNRLLQYLPDRGGMKKAKYVGKRKAMLFRQTNIDAVIGSRCLQFKIKRAAKALA